MNLFRSRCISRIFTVFTAVIFLNMSFFLTEVRLLNLDKDKDLVENIVKLISGAGLEEERDGAEESTEGTEKIVDFYVGYHGHTSPLLSQASIRGKYHVDNRDLSRGCVEIQIPPPRF